MPDYPIKQNVLPTNTDIPIRGTFPKSYIPSSVGSTSSEKRTVDDFFPEGTGDNNFPLTYTSKELQSKRFPIYDPTKGENEFAYAQGWGEKMINGIGKGLVLAGTTFLQTTAGLLNGVGSAISDGRFASFYDNDMNRGLDRFNKEMEDRLPNYYTDAEKEAHWYSPSKLFSANFLWDGIVKNLGFAAGAALSGGVYAAGIRGVTSMLSQIPKLAKLVSIGKAADALAATETELLGAEKFAESTEKILRASNKFLNQYNVLNKAQRITVAGLATTGEAGFEALQNMNQFREQKIAEYTEKNGKPPIGMDLQKINKASESVGNYSIAWNIALLSATNYIQFPKILGSSYKAEKGVINNLVHETRDIVREGEKYAEKVVRGGPFIRGLNKARRYAFSATEAFEEGSQYAITVGTQDFFDKKNRNEDSSVISSLIEGISKTLTTDEGMENVLIGGISGAIMLARGKFKEGDQLSKNTRDAIKAFNESNLSPFTKDTYDAVNRGVVIQQEREKALKEGRITDSKDLEHDYIVNYLIPRIKYGRYDLVMSDIEDYKRLASTEEGWTQLVAEGKAQATDTKESYLKRLIGLEKTAGNMKSLYQSLHVRYGGMVDEEGKPKYSPPLIDKMVYAVTKIADYDQRIESMIPTLAHPELLGAGVDINAIVSDLSKGDYKSFDKAVEVASTIKDVNKEEVDELLKSIGVLVPRREQFRQEYEEMKSTPEKYQDVPDENIPSNDKEPISTKDDNGEELPKKKIAIKTKYGDRQVETNTNYIVGKVIEKDENGNDVFRAPVIQIVDENEDGTIKIKFKNKNGEYVTRDIDKKKLEDYSLSKYDNIMSNKKLKFLYEHWNTIFKNHSIKRANGEPVTGRLEYTPENNKLVFKYIDDKGKERKREVVGKNFVTRPNYVHPMIQAIGELKASQKQAQEEFGEAESTLSDQLRIRNNIITSLYENSLARVEKITKTLELNRQRIAKIQETLKEEQTALNKKKVSKKKIAAITLTIKDLTKAHEDLEKENIDLQNEKEELEYNMPIFKEILDNIDKYADEATEIVEQLTDDINNSKTLIDKISEQINTNKSLLKQLEKVLSESIAIFNDYVKKLKEKNPDIPLFLDEFQANIEKYLGEEGAKQLIADRLGFTEQVMALEADVNAFEEELNIPELSKKVEGLKESLSVLEEQLKKAIANQNARAEVLEAFKEYVDIQKQEEEEEKKFQENEELKKQYIGTLDNSVQNHFNEVKYEPASKKSFWSVIRGTRPFTDKDNPKPHHVRANKFGFNFARFSDDKKASIKGVIVNSSTQDDILPGLVDLLMADLPAELKERYKKKDVIALVMVQMNDDGTTYSIIDENGDVIPQKDENGSEIDALSKAIFQVFPQPNKEGELVGMYKQEDGTFSQESMFREDVPDERIKEATNQYISWREKQLKRVTLSEPESISVSFGNPELVTYVDDEGNTHVDKSARVSVKEAGFIAEEDLEKKQVITVSMTDTETEGEVTFKNSKGRVFLRVPGLGLAKLFNRKFSEKEANTIFDVILQISKNGVKKGEVSQETWFLINWLKTVVYWGIAHDINTNQRKPAGYNNIWFETVKEDGESVMRLFISGITTDSKQAFLFTPTALQERKYEIVQLLQNLYHNTHAPRVNQDSWKTPYNEIIGIGEDGIPITREWANYQTYLLSDKTPENKNREKTEIPLVTQYRPLVDDNDVNRDGIYFTLISPTEEFKFEDKPKKAKQPATKKEAKAPAGKKAGKKEAKKEEGEEYKPVYKLDGSDEIMHFELFGGFDVIFNIDAKTVNETKDVGVGVSKEIIDKLIEAGKAKTEQEAKALIGANIYARLKDQIALMSVPKAAPIEDAPKQEPSEKEIPPSVFPDDDIPPIKEYDAENRAKPFGKPVIYEKEDWKKVEKWLSDNFPMLPVYRVRNVIRGTNGKQAWGMLHKAAIYLEQNAEVGTAYHEVFEAVWKMFAGPEEKQSVLDEFRSREREYTDRVTGEKIKYSEATPQQIKEELAEEFRDFILYGKTVAQSKGKNFISRLFADIVNFFKEFFTGEKAQKNTQALFDKIGNGYYKKFNAYESKLSFANAGIIDVEDAYADETSELREKIPMTQTHEIIQHMTFALLRDLTKTNQSLFKIEKMNKADIYNSLKREVLGRVKGVAVAAVERSEKGSPEASDEVNALAQLYNNINSEWDSLVKRHELFLNTMGLSFDENDEITMENEEKSINEPYGNPRKIDSFRKSNSAIKLLLGSLTYSVKVKRVIDGKEQITTEFRPSSIGGAQLLAADQVHIDLLNKLSNSVDFDDMMDKLRDAAIQNPNYVALYTRLTKQPLSKPIDYDNFEEHDFQLLMAFWKSMKLQNPEATTVFILPGGEVVVSDSSLTTAAKQAKKEMFYSMVDKIKSGIKFFKYNKNTGKYTVTNELKNVDFSGSSIDTHIAFLKELGVDFDADRVRNLRPNQLAQFRKAVENIKLSFSNFGPIVNKNGNPVDEDGNVVDLTTRLSNAGKPQDDRSLFSLTSKTLDIEGRLTQLGIIKSILETPEFESTYFNINGERTQTYIGINTLSRLHDVLSKLQNVNQLKEDRYKQFGYLLTDVFAEGSVVLKKIFLMEKNGDRIEDTENIMHPVIIDGMDDEEKGKKKESSRQTYKQRLIQEINANTNGIYLNLVPGDASIEHGVRMHEERDPFVTEESFLANSYLSIFKEYFYSEVKLARDKRRVVGKNSSKDLRFFKAILGEELHDEIMSKENKKTSPEDLYNAYKDRIESAVKQFVSREAEDTYDLLREFGIIEHTAEGIVVENLRFAEDVDLTEENIKTKLKVLSVNYIIANIELHKLLYSDPYQYNDELKRIKNFLSPRQPLMHGSTRINNALHNVYNKGYKKGDVGYSDMNRDYFKVVTLEDVQSFSDLEGYDPFEETDGAGLITLKGNRIFGMRTGNWTEDNERQYRHDMEYERIAEDKNLTDAQKKKALIEHEKNNPDIKDTYTPRKPIVSGNQANGRNYNDVVLHKFALSVTSYRILHKLNPESNSLKLYNKMQEEDVDYAVFKSAVKVGAEKTFSVYNKDGSFNDTPFDIGNSNPNSEREVSHIPFSIISIQSEVPSKDSPFVTTGSQMTKLVTMDYMEAGVPIDYMPEESNFDKRFAKWTQLKDKSSYNDGKNLYNEIERNKRLLEARIELAYQDLLTKLGIEKTSEGFKITDREKLISTLSEEIMKREVNDNIVAAFNGFKNSNIVLEATPSYKEIRNILYSIADKTVVRPKISGGQKVQIPSTFLESIRAEAIPKKNSKGKTADVYSSTNLKMYKNADGERYCEIMVARWFDSDKTDDELLDYFNNDEEGKKQAKALFGVGFRIPTQKQNSIDAFKIAKFLPREYGDSVVIPSALVKKAGSDFDIDKLSIYLKNVYSDIDGNIKMVPSNMTKEQVYEEYDKGTFLSPDQKEHLQKFIDKEREVGFRKEGAGIAVSAENILLRGMFPEMFTDEALTKAFVDEVLNKGLREVIVSRIYKQSLDNAYIESTEALVSHPLNFANLTKPNSAKQMKDLEERISKKLGNKAIDYTDVGNILSRKFMSSLRQDFIGGKRAIAIAAVGQTNNAQNQRALMFVDVERLKGKDINETDRTILGGNPESETFAKDLNINFQEYNHVTVKGKKVATLSKIKDGNSNQKKRNFISDIIGQFIDGYVDISKDPWIIRLGATPNLTSTWLFLLKVGVPINTVAYFMNQPIIKEYVKKIEDSGYSWLFINDFIDEVSDRYKPLNPAVITPVSEIPSEEDLYDMIGEKTSSLSDQQLLQQQYMLKEFLKYSKQASHLFQVVQGSNFDTATLNDPFIAFKKLMQYERAKKTIISSVDDIIDASFIKKLKEVIYNIRDAFSEVLISDKGNTRSVMEKVLLPYIDLNDRDFVKVAQKAVADLFDWAMQTDKSVANKIVSVLLGKNEFSSYAKQIIDFRDGILGNPAKDIEENIEHPLHNNFVLKSLRLKSGSKEGKADNLYIAGKENKVYNQNLLIHGFEEIRDYLKEQGDDTIYRKLVALAIMQSGLKNSIISFTNLLPYEDFKEIYNETLFKLNDLPYINDFYTAHVFERVNYNNDDLVPFFRDKFTESKKEDPRTGFKNKYYKSQWFVPKTLKNAMANKQIPKVIVMPTLSQAGNSDFFVYSWQDKITKKKLIRVKKTGDTSHIHKLLMKKVYFINEKGEHEPLIERTEDKKTGIIYEKFVFKAINTLGDSFMAQEFPDKMFPNIPSSTLMRASFIDNGFDKVEEKFDENDEKISSGEVEDETVVYYFNKKVNVRDETNAPNGKPDIGRTDKTCK